MHIIRGTWTKGGYREGRDRLLVEMIDGIAYDADQRMAPLQERELRLDADGALTAWAVAAFLPDSGELERLARLGITFRGAA